MCLHRRGDLPPQGAPRADAGTMRVPRGTRRRSEVFIFVLFFRGVIHGISFFGGVLMIPVTERVYPGVSVFEEDAGIHRAELPQIAAVVFAVRVAGVP